MTSYSFSKLISPELKERLDKLKGSFTDEQLKVIELLENSTIVETQNSDGTRTYSLVAKKESDRSRYDDITRRAYAGLTGDDDFLKKKSYSIKLHETIRGIRASSATPYRKVTDLIALTAYDFHSNTSQLTILLSKLRERFNKDNNKASYIVDTILIFAEKEAEMGITRTVRQWYDTIMAIADKMEPEGEEELQLKTKVFFLENQLNKMKGELNEAKASLEHAGAEASMWHSKYEGMKEAIGKAEHEKQETTRLKQENAKQHEIIRKLKSQLESESMILDTARKYSFDKPLTLDGILNRFANDGAYKKREKALEDKISELQNKLGDKSVLLSVLAEGIKEFAEEKNIEEAHTLFEHLCYILIEEKGWTDNVADLKKFFKKARKSLEKPRIQNIYGDKNEFQDGAQMLKMGIPEGADPAEIAMRIAEQQKQIEKKNK